MAQGLGHQAPYARAGLRLAGTQRRSRRRQIDPVCRFHVTRRDDFEPVGGHGRMAGAGRQGRCVPRSVCDVFLQQPRTTDDDLPGAGGVRAFDVPAQRGNQDAGVDVNVGGAGRWRVCHGADHLPRLTELMGQYADLPTDLADASLVLLAEELGEGRIVSTDERDFHAYRWNSQHPFSNLLLAPA